MNDTMLFYLAVSIALLALAIVAAANMYWGAKMKKS